MKAIINFFTSISTLISIGLGIAVGATDFLLFDSSWWGSSIIGVVAFIASLIFVNWRLQKKCSAPLTEAQAILQEASAKIQRKAESFGQRPGGSEFNMRKNLETMQKQALEKALLKLDEAEQFYKWSPLLEVQVNTLRFQLHCQGQNYAEADKYMDNIMIMDPVAATMKMARQYKLNPIKKEKGEKTFSKGVLENWPVTKTYKTASSRMRSKENKSFVANVYAWMLIQKGAGETALSVLQELKKDGDVILLSNIELLQNRQASKVSCKDYGDQWWSLGLQQPPKQKVQQVRQRPGQGGRPF